MTSIDFRGKEFVRNHHLSIPFHPLEFQDGQSIGDDGLNGNLIVNADNLLALKALLPHFANQVSCIFIDPPYNTGNENWIYNDNMNAPYIDEWLGHTVGIDDGLRHDKWCAMMWPRLRLLYELLSPDGSLWVTIDNNESYRLRAILEEIFGEAGFIAEIAWCHSDNSNNNTNQFSEDFNTILVFSKDPDWRPNFLPYPDRQTHFSNLDDDPRGPWFDGNPINNPAVRENLQFIIPANMFRSTHTGHHLEPIERDHQEITHPPNGWRWELATMQEKFETGELRISDEGNRIIRRTYLEESNGLPPSSSWRPHIENDRLVWRTGHTRGAKSLLKRLFPERASADLFPTPKPVELLNYILQLATRPGDLVLDSFAGSGTTAHAVLEMNAATEDDARRFILVEMMDYCNTETAERVRRVINGTDNFDPIPGTFSYFTLGPALDAENILAGEDLPPYEQLGQYMYNLVTSEILNPETIDAENHYLGGTENRHVWMIYQPNADWLKSGAAALTLQFARQVNETYPDSRHIVIAPANFAGHNRLRNENLQIEFVSMPYALFSQ